MSGGFRVLVDGSAFQFVSVCIVCVWLGLAFGVFFLSSSFLAEGVLEIGVDSVQTFGVSR